MDYSKLPIQPPAPLAPEATAADRAAWLDQHRICALYAQAEAQNRTADAAALGAAAQRACVEALDKPAPVRPFTEAEMVRCLLSNYDPKEGRTGDKWPSEMVAAAEDVAAAFFKKFPAQ
ncbi:MAG: hypothetical protein ACRCYS_14925 [Beijerinckiaceae bacterium]